MTEEAIDNRVQEIETEVRKMVPEDLDELGESCVQALASGLFFHEVATQGSDNDQSIFLNQCKKFADLLAVDLVMLRIKLKP